MKKQFLLAVLIIGLGSCTSAIPAAVPSISAPAQTFFSTAVFTTTPTSTLRPTDIPVTWTVTPERTPFTDFDEIRVSRVSSFGDSAYGYPDPVFHTFLEEPDGFAAFRFTLEITVFHFTKNERTPTPTALPAERWKVLVYRYRTDGMYAGQAFVDTHFTTEIFPYSDRFVMFMTADASMDEMRTTFGDCSAFAYQVIDGTGTVWQTGNISINPHVLFHSGGGLMGSYQDGVTLGFPYSLQERETEFFRQGRFVNIHEPESGFYRLTYTFDLAQASGIHGVSELEALAGKLVLHIFPHREDGNYAASDAYPVFGNAISVGGIYIVELPVDYLQKNSQGNTLYYLRVDDDKGYTIKEEGFMYILYNP